MNGEWREVLVAAPAPGQYVEIGRVLDHAGDVAPLDKLWWFPMNWNLDGMYWRPAQEPV